MPIVALLTDYGAVDSYVSEVKAVILRYRRDVQLVDISHEVGRYNVLEAAFVLRCASKTFPEDTVFLCVVDPGVGSHRKGLVINTSSGKRFVGPDNGLMYPAAEEEGVEEVCSIDVGRLNVEISQTFHGRDVFAHVVGMMISGKSLGDVLQPFSEYVRLELPRPDIGAGRVTCQILHVDRFGNSITNLHQSQIPANLGFFDVHLKGRNIGRIPLAHYYSAVNPGEPLFLVGGTGYLELAVNGGSAADRFRIKAGDRLILTYQGLPPSL
ncbi:Adenosyl-chloride synthase [archaeon HR01]|nr:Adenosyl-chloride synthase [archaeon HR01]